MTENNFRKTFINPLQTNSYVGHITTIADSSGFCTKSSFYDNDMLDYLLKDIMKQKADEAEKKLQEEVNEKKRKFINDFINEMIDDVVFNGPATIIKFKNGEKVVVKCQPGEKFDHEKGLALALVKYFFGNIGYYNEIFKKFIED